MESLPNDRLYTENHNATRLCNLQAETVLFYIPVHMSSIFNRHIKAMEEIVFLLRGARSTSPESNQTPRLLQELESAMDADLKNQGHRGNSFGSDSQLSRTSKESTKPGDEAHLGDIGTKSSASSIMATPEQTEYKSYTEYPGHIKQSWPQYEDLWQCLNGGKSELTNVGAFRILISDSGKDGIKGNMWASDASTGYMMSKKVASRITAPPSENVQVRIISLELTL